MSTKEMTFAIFVGNRGFMPAELLHEGREEMKQAVTEAGYRFLIMEESATRYGAVETREEGRLYAQWLKEHQGQYDGVICCMPIFIDENGAAIALQDAGVPILMQAYAFYDDEIIRRAAGTTGYSTKLIEEQEENMTSGVLYDLMTQMYTYAPAQESPKDAVFSAERSIILDVARKGNCVIVGRCSDWILRDDPHCLRVWIQSSEQARIARIMEYDHCDAASARTIMIKGDHNRAMYYQYYTRRVWGLARNFHLAIDTTLGYDYARETIAGTLKTLQNNLTAKV